MYSTHQQQPYSYHNFKEGNQHYNGDESRWSSGNPRSVSSEVEQLWRMDEPALFESLHYDGNYVFQDYPSQNQTSAPQYTSSFNAAMSNYESAYRNGSRPPDTSSSLPDQSEFSTHNPPLQLASLPQYAHQSSTTQPTYKSASDPYPQPYYPPPASSTSNYGPPSTPNPRLIYNGEQNLTLSTRYVPSFENLPMASIPHPPRPVRHSSLNSLKDFGCSSSPPRGRPATANSSSPSSSSPLPLRSTPRRLNSNLSISIDRAAFASHARNHSPTSPSSRSYPTSPFRSLPSPLSPARKRPYSGELAPNDQFQSSSLSQYSQDSSPTNERTLQNAYERDATRRWTGESSELGGFDYRKAFVDQVYAGNGLEQGVGELQIASRPASSSAYPSAYYPSPAYQQPFDLLPAPPAQHDPNSDLQRGLREEEIRKYLRATDKLQAGERTVLIFNPRIAQRSYGTERRLLNPPPMAYLLGTSWHSSSTTSFAGRLPSPPSNRQIPCPPEVFVSIYPPRSVEKEAHSSKEANPTAMWMARDGKTIIDQDENPQTPISGRFVSKSLAVSLDGDLNKDTVSDVRTVVTVVDRATQATIGTFLGKPMTVISKPSKKKSISAGGTAGLTHGGLVALFNRAKAGSGSTRYLCTSGPQSNFPSTDWRNMTSNAPRPFAPNDTSDVRFISKTNSWDAFIIYTVDLSLPTAGESLIQLPAPQQGYPKPPLNIVPVDTRKPQALYYNQPVVLQCLATGVVSPVLILRRIDSKAIAIGGGSIESALPNAADLSYLPVAPGEKVGEPISQYKNIAFEVYQAVSQPRSDNPFDFRLPTSSFLACLHDEIGIHVAEEEKTIFRTEAPLTPPPVEMQPSRSRSPLYASTNSYMPLQAGFDAISESSSDDSDSKRKRARTSTTLGFATPSTSPPSPGPAARPSATSRHKRRGQSLSSLQQLQKSRSPSPRQEAQLVWTVPCGESSVWSILAIDIARHSFYIPPSVEALPYSASSQSAYGESQVQTTPVPATPIGPILVTATRCDPAQHGLPRDHEASYAVLYGENFDASYTIWVGDQPCPEQIDQSTTSILFRPPPPTDLDQFAPPRRISLVRYDGVVFPTNIYYRD